MEGIRLNYVSIISTLLVVILLLQAPCSNAAAAVVTDINPSLFVSTDAIVATGYVSVVNNQAVLVQEDGMFVAAEVGGVVLGSTDPSKIAMKKLFSDAFYNVAACEQQRSPALFNARQPLDATVNEDYDITTKTTNQSAIYLFLVCQPAGVAASVGGKLYVSVSVDFGLTWKDPTPVVIPDYDGTLSIASSSVLLVDNQSWMLSAFLVSKNTDETNGCITRVVMAKPTTLPSTVLTASVVPIATSASWTGAEDVCLPIAEDGSIPLSAAVSASASASVNGSVVIVTQVAISGESTVSVRAISCVSALSALCTLVSNDASIKPFISSSATQVPDLMAVANVATIAFNSSTMPEDIASCIIVHSTTHQTVQLYSSPSTTEKLLTTASDRVASTTELPLLPSSMKGTDYFISATGFSIAFLPTLPGSISSSTGVDDKKGEVDVTVRALIAYSSRYVSHTEGGIEGLTNLSVVIVPVMLSSPLPAKGEDEGNPAVAASITFAIFGGVTIALISYLIVGKIAERKAGGLPEESDDDVIPHEEPVDCEREPLVRNNSSAKSVAGAINSEVAAADIYTPRSNVEGAADEDRYHMVKEATSVKVTPS